MGIEDYQIDDERFEKVVAGCGSAFFNHFAKAQLKEDPRFQSEPRSGRPITWGPERLILHWILVEAVRLRHKTSVINACRHLSKKPYLPITDPKGVEVLFATRSAIVGPNIDTEMLRYHYKRAQRMIPELPGPFRSGMQALANHIAGRR